MNRKSTKKKLGDEIISLILITHNDEDIIVDRLKEIKNVLRNLKTNFEILVVDNNSSDETIEKIKKAKDIINFTRILVLSNEYETEIALTAGVDNCIGDYAILFDTYTDPKNLIFRFANTLAGGYDIVVANKRTEIAEFDALSRFILQLSKNLSQHGFHYHLNYSMALSRKVINSIIRTRRKSRHFNYISSLVGFKKKTINYSPIRKYKNKLKINKFHEVVVNTFDIVVSNSFKPIRFVSMLGLFLSTLFLVYVLGIVILIVFLGMKNIAPQGWISLATVMGTLFFLLFSILTLISEYTIRILIESRDEPFYFVSEEISKSTILPGRKTKNIVS